MRPAPAQYSGEGHPNLFVGWIGVLVQKSLCGQDHAADAVSALRCLLVDKGLLDRVRMLKRSETLQRDDLVACSSRHGSDARADGFTAGKHRARPALAKTATELRPIQLKVLPQGLKQRSRRIDVNRRGAPVDGERAPHFNLESVQSISRKRREEGWLRGKEKVAKPP